MCAPPRSCMLRRIVINNRVGIILVCTRIIRSSLFTWPSWWASSIYALPLNCHNRTIHLDMVES